MPAASTADLRDRHQRALALIRELIGRAGMNATAVASLSLVEKLLLKR